LGWSLVAGRWSTLEAQLLISQCSFQPIINSMILATIVYTRSCGAPCSGKLRCLRTARRQRNTTAAAGGPKNPEHIRQRRARAAQRRERPRAKKPKPKQVSIVTAPPSVEVEKVLQTSAPALKPWWSTFIGHLEGVWAGKCAAFNPATAQMEPLSIDQDNMKIKELHTMVTETVCVPKLYSAILWAAHQWRAMYALGSTSPRFEPS
jgi:hypothetical protein